MGSTVVQSAHEPGLFGCCRCGGAGPLFSDICEPCLNKAMEAWNGPATDAEFEAWWGIYPRRVGKDAAREKYRKARKRVSAEALLEGARAYSSQCSSKELEFIAHPATWLNQGRWQDEQESYDCGPRIDMDRKHVEDFVRDGFWSGAWGPKPDQPDAEPRIRRLYQEIV